MKEEVARYTRKEVAVTPFGVDVNVFRNLGTRVKDNTVNIGTIKPIEEKYGIIHIIEAAEKLIGKKDGVNYRFYLIGSGSNLAHYRKIISSKGLDQYFEVTGRIPFSEISKYHNMLYFFHNVSINDSESFGVATVEAMACEKPVIVTDVGGLMEVVNYGEFGLVIKRKDSTALADAITSLLADWNSALMMGRAARQHVLKHYDWQNNLREMTAEYDRLLLRTAQGNKKPR
jgi:glycosyltransferase involved in cell wall biosynthesis